ncbi:hypothetical protein GQ44DRAFT_725221 [Phaeosphaeriaceae sp. PMI808]|nr:hypothetical protein GQ44DRAFT_725221 [Phaeosphaeriaceae sp. PMI808]
MKTSALLSIISMALAASASALPNEGSGSCNQSQAAACCILGVCVAAGVCDVGNIAICCNNLAIACKLVLQYMLTEPRIAIWASRSELMLEILQESTARAASCLTTLCYYPEGQTELLQAFRIVHLAWKFVELCFIRRVLVKMEKKGQLF